VGLCKGPGEVSGKRNQEKKKRAQVGQRRGKSGNPVRDLSPNTTEDIRSPVYKIEKSLLGGKAAVVPKREKEEKQGLFVKERRKKI